MTFGPQVDSEDSLSMVRHYLAAGHVELDTAYVYNGGDSERILGSILQQPDCTAAQVATKVNPRVTGKLNAAAVNAQMLESLHRLQREQVDILYLHFPDPHTPLEETLAACAKLHTAGRFRELGLSNFPAWEVVNIWHLCQARGWPVPTVYQGLYNGLSRKAEDELFPALRKLSIRFYAYNPLAGGLLSGKYKNYADQPVEGRFTHRPNYRGRYWKKGLFDALQVLDQACKENDIAVVEAAYRWLAFHSELDQFQGAGIVIGASSVAQLVQNLDALGKGPLPGAVGGAFAVAWEEACPECPNYFQPVAK